MKKITCTHCKGVGIVQHPFWKLYFEKYSQYDPREVYEGFAGRYTPNYESLPPEETECQFCKGKGYFKDEVEKIFFEVSEGSEHIDLVRFKIALQRLGVL